MEGAAAYGMVQSIAQKTTVQEDLLGSTASNG
jgi:hypothetical protein